MNLLYIFFILTTIPTFKVYADNDHYNANDNVKYVIFTWDVSKSIDFAQKLNEVFKDATNLSFEAKENGLIVSKRNGETKIEEMLSENGLIPLLGQYLIFRRLITQDQNFKFEEAKLEGEEKDLFDFMNQNKENVKKNLDSLKEKNQQLEEQKQKAELKQRLLESKLAAINKSQEEIYKEKLMQELNEKKKNEEEIAKLEEKNKKAEETNQQLTSRIIHNQGNVGWTIAEIKTNNGIMQRWKKSLQKLLKQGVKPKISKQDAQSTNSKQGVKSKNLNKRDLWKLPSLTIIKGTASNNPKNMKNKKIDQNKINKKETQ